MTIPWVAWEGGVVADTQVVQSPNLATDAHPRPRGEVPRRILGHLVLAIGVLVSIFPFYWMIVMASNRTEDILTYPPKLVPGNYLMENIQTVLDGVPFWKSAWLSLITAVLLTLLVLFFDSLAAFTFAKYQFPGKRVLFVIILATFMVPAQLSLVPQFVIMAQLGWVGSIKALIIPGAANAFGIFWMRQYAQGAIADELIDAATVDGAGFFRTYLTVGLPVLRPGLAFLGIFTFIASWNDYLWPLIVLDNPNHITLQVALQQLNGLYTSDYAAIMAGAAMATLPLLILFVVGARQFIADLAAGAMKF
jgi:cellobiose transport system permease protein